jgi:hypothetical protein
MRDTTLSVVTFRGRTTTDEEPRSLAVPLGAKTPEAQIVIAIRADNPAIPIQGAAGTAGDATVTGVFRQTTKRCWGHVVAPF